MSSGFSSHELLKSLSNYPVAKGDVAGHEFHGNQYSTSAGAATGATSLVGRAKAERDANGSAVDYARQDAEHADNDFDQKRNERDAIGLAAINVHSGEHSSIAEEHHALALAHTAMAAKIRDERPKNWDVMARRQDRAASSHESASRAHYRAASAADKLSTAMEQHSNNGVGSGSDDLNKALSNYKDAAAGAVSHSQEASFRSDLAHQYASVS